MLAFYLKNEVVDRHVSAPYFRDCQHWLAVFDILPLGWKELEYAFAIAVASRRCHVVLSNPTRWLSVNLHSCASHRLLFAFNLGFIRPLENIGFLRFSRSPMSAIC